MICTSSDYKVENYKDYRNRVMTKHIDKIKNQLRQIKDCSLKPEDKEKLKKQLIEIIKPIK